MSITVKYEEGFRFSVESRGHKLMIDQPLKVGGTDQGMMPAELFTSSLAGCIAVSIAPFCQRHNISLEGMEIEANYSMAKDPHRIGAINIILKLPKNDALDESIKEALLRISNTCTIHNSITNTPEIEVKLSID